MPSRISQMQSGTGMQTQTPMQPPMQSQNNQYIQSLRNTMNMLQNSRNPQAMLQNMVMQNPQLKQAMNLIQSFNGNPQQAFMNLAKMKGVDPNAVLNALQGK